MKDISVIDIVRLLSVTLLTCKKSILGSLTVTMPTIILRRRTADVIVNVVVLY